MWFIELDKNLQFFCCNFWFLKILVFFFFNTQATLSGKQLFNTSLTMKSTILLDVKIKNYFLPSATWQVNTLTYFYFMQILISI